MKSIRYILLGVILSLVGSPASLHAQSFFGYQTIGVHTWYFSLSWDGKPNIGFGYNFRDFNKTFTDISLEWRSPVDEMFQSDNQHLIAGFYKPLVLRRGFTAVGLHAHLRNLAGAEGSKTSQYSLAATVLPSYVYAASLGDGPYGTIGLRLGYEAVIAEKSGQSWSTLPSHGVRLGGHIDLHLERTLGISSNGFVTKNWALGGSEGVDTSLGREGDLYIGSTYFLRRW
ncbi:MAG: hypothetical protein NWR72_10505 [Bacteroidia bacterium]|nr:hypothetical protein [Bacteroidia bacterium]